MNKGIKTKYGKPLLEWEDLECYVKDLEKEIERLNNRLYKIKEYLKQVHKETQIGILSSNNLIWENIERLCDGKELLGSDKK